MKKIFSILAIVAFVCLTATSCEKASSSSGTATYSVGAREISGDLSAASQVLKIYEQKLATISGASASGAYITITGKYSESDSKVLSACKAAESEAGKVTFTGSDYVTVAVSVVYHEGGKTDDNFYVKTYGKK